MEFIAVVWSFLLARPIIAAAAFGIITIFAAVKLLPVFAATGRIRDPKRAYSAEDRQQGFARAGQQCEYDRWIFFRCTRTAQHGDHFYPWSKGGATSMRNFVAACPRCNCSKGAKLPSPFTRMRIQNRRRDYFPRGVPVDAGQWAVR